MSPKIKSAVVKTPQQPGKRRRVKKLHKDLLEQLEFYLSEASLRHDSFLREKAGERGMECIPIHVFLTFPLIQEMKVDKKNIITAVENSRILQISRDKNHIQRIFPITRPPHNLDRSTLYIENLPPDATIEWAKEVCRKVGAVRHISLPRYKKSGAIKGFAFVEFATPEDVARACRIFKDPPIHFYPNRAEKYLKYLNRVKMRENMNDSALETSPMLQEGVKSIPQSAESGLLSRSLDSALDFELVEDDEVPTSSGRKRKRRSRASSDILTINEEKCDHHPDKGLSIHTPAKKLKSLPTRLQYEGCAINKKDCTTMKDDCAITFSENYSKTDTVSVTMIKERTPGRKVLFSISDDNSVNLTKTDKFCQKCSSKSGDSENKICRQNGIPSDVKFEIRKNNDETRHHKECNTDEGIIDDKETFKSNIYGAEEKSGESVTDNSASLKRRRSCSEPPNVFDFSPVTEAKRMKGDATNEQPIISSQKDTAHNEQPITSLDIDAIILQGRLQAQATIHEDDFRSKRFLHSVVAKPEPKKPNKKRKKSRKSNKKDKLSTRQTPPQLIAMPKIQWLDMKKEYKHLQKHNMSRLKKTLRECKDAGSVFIKKHLDVLKDVNISNDSINSFESGDETNNAEQRDTKTNKRGPPTFKPGVIVRISAIGSNNKLPTIPEIKSMLNKYGQGVAYVDTNTSGNCGFVRFNDGDSAQRAIMEEKSLALCLLTGEAEEHYWDKLLAARAQKFARERTKVRGRTKILIRAEGLVEKAKRRHIRFDNDLAV